MPVIETEKNYSSRCAYFKQRGFCSHSHLAKMCPRTCGRCTASDKTLSPRTDASAHMEDYGQGYCNEGYLRGWDGRGTDTQAACNAVCMAEADCTYAAWNAGKTCSRYKEASCTLNGVGDHYTYKKVQGSAGGKMVYWDGCAGEKNRFSTVDAGDGNFYLKNVQSGRCVHTESATAVNGGKMVYWDGCAGEKNKFSKVDAGPQATDSQEEATHLANAQKAAQEAMNVYKEADELLAKENELEKKEEEAGKKGSESLVKDVDDYIKKDQVGDTANMDAVINNRFDKMKGAAGE